MKFNKYKLFLLFILLMGLVFRIYAASNIDINTDEMLYSILPYNLISSGRIGTSIQSPLYLYFTDLGYILFGGLSPISARFPSIFFGSLIIILIFRFVREFYKNTKAATISSFLFAFSGVSILYNYEMDTMAFFLCFLSIYFFLKGLSAENKYIYFSFVLLGLAILIKIFIILFIPVYLIIYLYYKYANIENFSIKKKDMYVDFFFGFIILGIILLPILIYNYLIYIHNGLLDFYVYHYLGKLFSLNLESAEFFYGSIADKSWSFSFLLSTLSSKLISFLKFDSILTLFGIFGITYVFKKNKFVSLTLILSSLSLYLVVGGKTGSPSHYLFIPVVLSIFSGVFLAHLFSSIKKKAQFHFLLFLIFSLFIFSMINIHSALVQNRSSSIVLPLYEFANDNFSEDVLVFVDPRIYRGIYSWAFIENHFIDGDNIPTIMNEVNTIKNSIITYDFFYIECDTRTYCGWKPESFKGISEFGESISIELSKFSVPFSEINTSSHRFIVRRGSLKLPPDFPDFSDKFREFWSYSVAWKYSELNIDNYPISGSNFFPHIIGRFILFFEIFLLILVSIYVVISAFRNN